MLKTTIDPCASSALECEMGNLVTGDAGCECECDTGFSGKFCNQLDISDGSRTNELVQPAKLIFSKPGSAKPRNNSDFPD